MGNGPHTRSYCFAFFRPRFVLHSTDLWVTQPGCGQVELRASCPRPGAGYPRVKSFYGHLSDYPARAALAAGPFTRPRRTAIELARPAGGLPEPGGGEGQIETPQKSKQQEKTALAFLL